MVEKVVMAQEEERRRIAHEVHDGIAQLIVSAKQHVDTPWRARPAMPTPREIDRATERLEGAIVETRRVLKALRPSAVDAVGLVEAMRSPSTTPAEAGWAARFVDELGDARVPPAVETATFRILQESLFNASRHAGHASRSRSVDGRAGSIWTCATTASDSPIPVPSDAASGLPGCNERARLLGGSCRIESPRVRDVDQSGVACRARESVAPDPEPAIRLLIVDDHPMVREGLRSMLGDAASRSWARPRR